MKKLIYLALLLVPVLFVTTVVSADPPPGVAPAVRVDSVDECSVGYTDDAGEWVPVYLGTYWLQFSNSKTGHMTFKCKMDLQEGFDPLILYWEFEGLWEMCYSTVSLEGNKGTWTQQCVGYWE